MSELNKKNSFNFLKFVLIYGIIAILATVSLIVLNKNDINLILIIKNAIFNTEIDNTLTSMNEEDDDKNITLKENKYSYSYSNVTDKCFKNNIEIKKIEETSGDIVGINYDNEDEYNYSINYIEISGLKDKNVEEKINSRIKEKAYAIKSEIKNKLADNDRNKAIKIFANDLSFNYNNVISLSFYLDVEDYSLEHKYLNELSKSYGLTMRLDTGDELKLKDIFMPDTNLKSILVTEAYKSVASLYCFDSIDTSEFEFSLNMDDVDYSQTEDDVFKFMSDYNNNSDSVEFVLFSGLVYVYPENIKNGFNVVLEEYNEDVAIYNKYLTKNSLFDNGNNDKDIYVFIGDYSFYQQVKQYNNFLSNVDLVVIDRNEQNDEKVKKYYDFYLNKVFNKIKNYDFDSRKSYIATLELYVNLNSEDKNYELTGTLNINEMDNEFYNENKEYIYRESCLGDYSMIYYKNYYNVDSITAVSYVIRKDLVTDEIKLHKADEFYSEETSNEEYNTEDENQIELNDESESFETTVSNY